VEGQREPLALALRALAAKERTVAELGEWLLARGVEEQEAAIVVDQLVEIGTLDDERFARRFAEDKRDLARWGSERIRDALLGRGVESPAVEAALAAEDREAETGRAAAILLERGADLSDERGRERALGLLARRGFESELAYDAVRRASRDPDLA
jgi:regulatory protein